MDVIKGTSGPLNSKITNQKYLNPHCCSKFLQTTDFSEDVLEEVLTVYKVLLNSSTHYVSFLYNSSEISPYIKNIDLIYGKFSNMIIFVSDRVESLGS